MIKEAQTLCYLENLSIPYIFENPTRGLIYKEPNSTYVLLNFRDDFVCPFQSLLIAGAQNISTRKSVTRDVDALDLHTEGEINIILNVLDEEFYYYTWEIEHGVVKGPQLLIHN